MRLKIVLFLIAFVSRSSLAIGFFKPFNVSYDGRALLLDGQRRILISAGIHYPRAAPEMWPDLVAKTKENGVDVVQSYVFWNGHEPVRGQYNFEGQFDIVKFVKLVGLSGLYLHLRIGPYVCAEWNFGGFPVWLRDIPGIKFRTDNGPFKVEMERFVKKIIGLMKQEMLFSWQGGPIILLQIENEYGNIEDSYGKGGKEYVKWAARMALGQDAGVPWVMCRQNDAPENIDTCNAYYCDGYKPNSKEKPIFWTEDWDGWYASWGGRLPHRPVRDLAFAVARFFERGGSFQNYYMFFGGTNFGRTSGGPFYTTSYDYDAPIDEYGLLRQPRWGHLKNLHEALRLCEPALVSVDVPDYVLLGIKQEAHVYREPVDNKITDSGFLGNGSVCSAFLANMDERHSVSVKFLGQTFHLPPWSVSILPDCKNVAFNTAKVQSQTSLKLLDRLSSRFSTMTNFSFKSTVSWISESWQAFHEPIGVWSPENFTMHGVLEHLNITKDSSDYLWYITRIYISDEDILHWKVTGVRPSLTIDRVRDVVRVFVNGNLAGNATGHWAPVNLHIDLKQGENELAIVSQTMGLQNYGAFLEKDGAGLRGQINLKGLKGGVQNLLNSPWTYQVGLKGEFLKIYDLESQGSVNWSSTLPPDTSTASFTWYKATFSAPDGADPVAIDLGSMGKGQAWVNGKSIGRYWTIVAPKHGCPSHCDYRGAYNERKCLWNCGRPTQRWYHVPRSWLQESSNLLVLFEEIGGNPLGISIMRHATDTICATTSESDYPPLHMWQHPDIVSGDISITEVGPELDIFCDYGQIISSIEFASYGNPQGSCQQFSEGNCHASKSFSVVSEACRGKNRCTISVSNEKFGEDPCPGVVKTLAVEAKCMSASDVNIAYM
ncbi:beta-galactosidase 9 isoform X2 [Nymphaea colorata]|uniref:beta-galactosidase 9 isoform X2 n=1 Tax=Nymphaea colorata TaxID=210225 RepID=UPI00129EF5C8|nr:beta-galactosidase 9 isoform X2 [Nymphaea colorata]